MRAPPPISGRRLRTMLLVAVAALLLAVWAFPVLWALLTSFKTERDVLAYPPTMIFEPTLSNYRDVMFGSASLLSSSRRRRIDAVDAALRRAGRICARAPRPGGQARVGVLRDRHANAAPGRVDHPVLPRAAEDRRARHLWRTDLHLPDAGVREGDNVHVTFASCHLLSATAARAAPE